MRSLKEYSVEISKNKGNPGQLSLIYLDLVSRYAYESEQTIPLRIARAEFWEKNKSDSQGKIKSDVKLEREWLLTPEGQKYDAYKIDMKAIEIISKSLTSISVTNAFEAKNQI